MNVTSRTLVVAASFLLAGSVYAQQPKAPADQPPGARPQNRGNMHHESTQMQDQQEERGDEMQDLDQLGLPMGDFWRNPQLVQRIGLTPDQVHRLSEANLQGRLKIIQLDANLEMEQAKLEAMLDAPTVDAGGALAQTDHVADARAAIEKADAHLAFELRGMLMPEQLGKLRMARMHGMMGDGAGMGPRGRQGYGGPMQQAPAQ